jgi:Ca2+-binding RTX toxin-like protein
MRPIILALIALAAGASPASAAVVQLEDRSSPEDNTPTTAIVVSAKPGETNLITVRQVPGGIAIDDAGAPLTGACQATATGRLCRGAFFGAVDVYLGDGNDTLQQDYTGAVVAGAGNDDIRVTKDYYTLVGNEGADRLDATGAAGASVFYAGRTAPVSATVNGIADDGEAGEGDNLIGAISGITGGEGSDNLVAGPATRSLVGNGGNDMLLASTGRSDLLGGTGNDQLLGGNGTDFLQGGPGADFLSGGDGLDEVNYGGDAPLRLSIGDGANDGAAGEGDDIRSDVESLTGGQGDDVLIGDDGRNRLIAYGGQDVLRGEGGPDRLYGWDDGDELDPGAGLDQVYAGSEDLPLLEDGEVDTLSCRREAPAIEADADDVFRACAPLVRMTRHGKLRVGRRARIAVRCPIETTLPCEGNLRLRIGRHRRASRLVHFGPIEPGDRAVVRPRVRALPHRKGRCLYAKAVTRRYDGFRTRTFSSARLFCVPR